MLRRALRAPLSVSLLAIGALVGLVSHDAIGLAVFVAGVVGATIYTITKLQDEAFIRAAIREDASRRHDSDVMDRMLHIEELDVDSRIKMKMIVRLQNEIAEDVANSPIDEVAAGLTDTVEQTDSLIERGLAMATKRRNLLRYLNKTDERSIETRIASLQARLAAETDPTQKSEIELSIAAKQHELHDYRAIELAADRVLSQLDSIECSLASLRARLVRIKSTDIAEWAQANEELRTELGSLNAAVDVVEQSVNEAMGIGDR